MNTQLSSYLDRKLFLVFARSMLTFEENYFNIRVYE